MDRREFLQAAMAVAAVFAGPENLFAQAAERVRSLNLRITDLKTFAVDGGNGPVDIEHHWQGMFRGPRYRDGALMMSALSAVEIALWDILGLCT